MGDTLVALPSFHLIRQRYPESRIVLLTNSPVDSGVKAAPSHQVLIGSGLVDDYLEYPHGSGSLLDWVNLLRGIRRMRPSKLIYLMPVRNFRQRVRDAVFFGLAGFLRPQGMWSGRDGYRHREVVDRSGYYESEAIRLARTLGFSPDSLCADLFSLNLGANEREAIEPILRKLKGSQKFIAISVGTKAPANDWGQERWVELVSLLSERVGQRSLVFFGSGDERARCQSLLDLWAYGGLNLCGQVSPRQSAAILEGAVLYVGHDSGPMHLASSVGIPSVGIFSGRNKPGIWFPYGNEKNVFYNMVSCNGCGLTVCVEQQMRCIRSIEAHDVAHRILGLLSGKSGHRDAT
ncbi:MAG: glycosyltransferase family 9 protein [Sulfuricella sp.]